MSNVGVSVGNHRFWAGRVLMIAERMMGGAVHPEMIEEMDRELTHVIEDFDRAVNVEALRVAKKTGKHSLSQSDNDPFSGCSCRARASASAAHMCRSRSRLASLLYGRHPPIYSQSSDDLGSEFTGYPPWECLLGVRLTGNRQIFVSSFDLRKPS